MAFTHPDPFSELWLSATWDDPMLQLLVDQKVQQVKARESGLLKKIATRPAIMSVKPQRIEQHDYPHEVTCTLAGTVTRTLTVTGDLFHKTATRALMLRVLRAQAQLIYTAAGVDYPARVTAIDATNPVVTIEAWNSGGALPTNGTGQVWRVVGQPFTDAEDASEGRMLDAKLRFVSTQIFSDTFKSLKTWELVKMHGDINKIPRQFEALYRKLRIEMANALIMSEPVLSAGVIQTMEEEERPTMAGLRWLVATYFGAGGEFADANAYRNLSGNAVDLNDWDEIAFNMAKAGTDFGSGDWWACVHPYTRQYMHDYNVSIIETQRTDDVAGNKINYLDLKIGKKVPIFDDWYMPVDKGYLIDISQCGHAPLKGDELSRGELPTGSTRNTAWQISFQEAGLIIDNLPVSVGGFYNGKVAA